MSGVTPTQDEAPHRRTRYPGLLAGAIGCYVLAVIVGTFFLGDSFGLVVQILLWLVHGALLIVMIRKLGAGESSAAAALFIVLASAMSVHVIGVARDDLTLQQRGEKSTATVVREWRDPAQGRKARDYHYELKRVDGSDVPGPAMRETSDRFAVGQVITVIEDPEGDLRPQTPGQADVTGDALGAGALALAALGAVGWMTWRGSDTARRRDEQKGPGRLRKVYKTVTRDHSTQQEQEEKLRVALRTCPADRRGYLKVAPEEYPDLTHGRAARVAWEMGMRAEAVGDRGSWRFKETVAEEVPLD
jgi:hypothetical protein